MSSRSKLLLACLLSSSSTNIVRALATEKSLSGNSWLPKNTPCGFRIGNYLHDLCPLFERRGFTLSTIQFDESDLKTETYTFGATFGDELSPCPEGTFVCWNKPETSSSTAVVTSFKLTAISQLNSFDVADTPDPVAVELNGTLHNSELHSMRIQFICDENIDQDTSEPLSMPSFLGRHDGVHYFSWKSSYACPREANVFATTILKPLMTLSTTPTHTVTATSAPKSDHNDEDNGDQSNLTDPVSSSDARRKAVIILLIIGLIIITSLSLYHHPPRTLIDNYIRPSLDRISPYIRSVPIIHIPTLSSHTFTLANVKSLKLPSFKRSRRRHHDSHRPYRFRVGENKLVQWATEDSRLISEIEGGEVYDFEEDFMVNGIDEEVDGAYLGEDVGAGAARGSNGEYVPLSAGMRWGMTRGVRKNYGTAGTAA